MYVSITGKRSLNPQVQLLQIADMYAHLPVFFFRWDFFARNLYKTIDDTCMCASSKCYFVCVYAKLTIKFELDVSHYYNAYVITVSDIKLACTFHSGLRFEDADELTVEDIMEEHCDELQDEEVDVGFSDTVSDLTKETRKRAKAKSNKRKSKHASDQGQGSAESMGADLDQKATRESEKWKPRFILTEWGRTDDVVTIGNGEEYYFFKMPHKARVSS